MKEDKCLRKLTVTNCGLGPEGGEMIAKALQQNTGLKLTHFHAGRDRLEDKGITALAKVFEEMASLEELHVPQNGIKDAGMKELFSALKSCKNLHTLRVNDNWIKKEATEQLLGLMLACQSLKELNISDGNMGTANVLAALRAAKKAQDHTKITYFSCNYNDVESKVAAAECLQILLEMESIKTVDFIGNVQSRKFTKEWQVKFTDSEKDLKVTEEEEMDDDEAADADEEEDEEEEDDGYKSSLSELCEKLD